MRVVTTKSRLKDLGWYLLISVALVSALLYAASSGLSRGKTLAWSAFVLFVLLPLGNFILTNKSLWRKTWFRWAVACSLTVNVAVFEYILHAGYEVLGRLLYFGYLLEFSGLYFLRDRMLGRAKE